MQNNSNRLIIAATLTVLLSVSAFADRSDKRDDDRERHKLRTSRFNWVRVPSIWSMIWMQAS